MTTQRLRVAAYAVCLRDEHLLLARWVSPDRARQHWTLPGGGVEHAEDPFDAVVREVAEETGYEAQVEQLLGVNSRTRNVESYDGGVVDLHMLAVFYRARIVAGELRFETDGTTDLAQWIPLAEVAGLERSVVVDIGLDLHGSAPLTGHAEPIRRTGLMRH
ncbi:ADP-ribose pyrophosphatase YjhB (NUDIX family) [Micromonospora luteifusca]|uniref:ADP-ribose pyrophosphatase YjhB (NUDIX family) n=1 Tax=Micromonospora luteifusca TaxID=709860 RepID=A0ABS2M3X2_9ACTN|nr:NUDIX hydrolase [Micromonospora luteifusca]MBM7495111.1 ADP-ribose pyrophosphatase YjhB (NUDIX family) [Micromonospora luteifusca]